MVAANALPAALPTLRDVEAAARRIKDLCIETPLLESPPLNRRLGGRLKVDVHRPCMASCGAGLLFAELSSRAALAAAAPRPEIFARKLPRVLTVGIHLYV